MYLGAPRRTAKTYGKTNRTVLVHDLFQQQEDRENDSTTAASGLPRTSITKTHLDHKPQRSMNRLPSSERQQPLPVENLSDINLSKSQKPSAPDISMYDIHSSDEDASTDTSGSRASKRRRISRETDTFVQVAQERIQSAPSQLVKPQELPKKSRYKANNSVKDAEVVPISETKATARPDKSVPAGATTLIHVGSSRTKPVKSRPVPRITKTKTATVLGPRQLVRPANMTTASKIEHLSAQSGSMISEQAETPCKSRPLSNAIDSDLSSPGQLGTTTLKIAAVGFSPERLPSEPTSDESSTQTKKGRRRLVDRLDAPSKSEDGWSGDQSMNTLSMSTASKSQRPNHLQSKLALGVGRKKQSQPTPVEAEGSNGAHKRVVAASKPRTTYASQRSHLSDMVNDLDPQSAPSSQKSTDDLLLLVPTSTLASQLELEEEESDDQAGNVRLKSIHELRQAGANNRFDREVDALLEDINASDQSSKAIRLQALMKMATRLKEPAFLQHMAGSGRTQRLFLVAGQSPDLLTAMLLVRVLSVLSRSEEISIATLGQIFSNVSHLAPDMLTDVRSLAKIAKDRKQNLSKSMIQDLAKFDQSADFSSEPSTVAHRTHSDFVTMDCMEHTLRRLLQLGDTSARISTPVYSGILRSLFSQVQDLRQDQRELISPPKLETALSLLELCSVVVDDADLHVSDDEYELLGNALADIVFKSETLPRSLERSVLRVVVSLSNNKPRMCRLLGTTMISRAAFGIINQNFLGLARQAENEQALDESKLDSVVLALGCLLNFAECDSTLRVRLSQAKLDDENYVAQLVSIFNAQVSKVDEAMTKEQSQVSVAFGYLSMLLCALSLHPSIKTQVTRLLKDSPFEALCSAAEKFFSHLRTLEHISEDDSSLTSFTARFGAILDTIRASDV